jgi:hypothetical protein
MDRLLGRLLSHGMRRGLAGQPAWLALALAVWLVRRARRRGPTVVWRGRLTSGERLHITAWEPTEGWPGPPAG